MNTMETMIKLNLMQYVLQDKTNHSTKQKQTQAGNGKIFKIKKKKKNCYLMHCIHANKCNYISLQRTLNKIFYSYDLSIGYKIGTVNTCRSRQVSDCVHSSRQPLPIYNSHCFILAEGAVKTVNLAFEDPIGFSNKIQTLK